MKKTLLYLFVFLLFSVAVSSLWYFSEQIESLFDSGSQEVVYSDLVKSNVMIFSQYDSCNIDTPCELQTSEEGSGTIYDLEIMSINGETIYTYFVLTNFHVISEGEYINSEYQGFLFEGSEVSLSFEYGNPSFDLAIMSFSLNHSLPVLVVDIADSVLPDPDTVVYAVGSPETEQNFISQGLLVGETTIPAYAFTVIQHTAYITNGSSGGALFTEDGLFLGINSFGNETEYFAIPVSQILLFFDSYTAFLTTNS